MTAGGPDARHHNVTPNLPEVQVPGVPGLIVRSALMDTTYCATILGIPHSTLERMIASGQVPHLKIGKHTRLTPGHLGEIIADCERRPRVGAGGTSRGSARTRL